MKKQVYGQKSGRIDVVFPEEETGQTCFFNETE
jgi:hypothetical protein